MEQDTPPCPCPPYPCPSCPCPHCPGVSSGAPSQVHSFQCINSGTSALMHQLWRISSGAPALVHQLWIFGKQLDLRKKILDCWKKDVFLEKFCIFEIFLDFWNNSEFWGKNRMFEKNSYFSKIFEFWGVIWGAWEAKFLLQRVKLWGTVAQKYSGAMEIKSITVIDSAFWANGKFTV